MKKIIVGIIIVGFLGVAVFPTVTMRFDRRWTPEQVMQIFSNLLALPHQALLRAKLEALAKQELVFNGGTISSDAVLAVISAVNMQASQIQ